MAKEGFFQKLFSPIIWVNLLCMGLFVVAVAVGLWIAMATYTHHGQSVDVPNVKTMLLSDAKYALSLSGLEGVVSDSSYNRALPAGCVLEQTPSNGRRVKTGREIYLTVNMGQTPTLVVPDIADNSSLREAEAKLKALGFKLGPIEYVEGDKDWVMGVKCKGARVSAGDLVPIDAPITLMVGNNVVEFEEAGDDYQDASSEEVELDEVEVDDSDIETE